VTNQPAWESTIGVPVGTSQSSSTPTSIGAAMKKTPFITSPQSPPRAPKSGFDASPRNHWPTIRVQLAYEWPCG
jgi:hypothetical protein